MFLTTSGSCVTLQFHQDVCSYYYSLYLEGRLTDVKLVIDGAEFKVHKLILAAQSNFFETLFYNQSMIESKTDEIQLKETDAEIFTLLLQISYGGSLQNAQLIDPDILIRLYILFERYQFVKLENTLKFEIAHKLINPDNFWHFLDVSVYYNVTQFIDLCLEFFDMFGKKDKTGANKKHEDQSTLFSNNNFVKISHETLKFLLDRNLNCPELLLLNATKRWIESNSNSVTNNEKCLLIKRIRLNLISEADLMKCGYSEIDFNDIRDAVELINTRYDKIIDFYLLANFGLTKQSPSYREFVDKARLSIIKNRSFHIPNYNICQQEFGFYLNNHNDSAESMEVDKMVIDKPVDIMISLGFPFKLNYIEMVMSDLKGDKFSYSIEYSVDGFNWSILYDYLKYLCANQQTLFFNPIVTRYFRIKGFHQNRMDNRTRKAFKSIKLFKAFFKELNPSIDVRLTDGVLNTSYYTCQIRHRVYCDTTVNMSPNERYYCQKISKDNQDVNSPVFKNFKPMFILFDQPIMLSSFSFKLYDKEECAYSYSVDIFEQNELTWENVTDRSRQKCTSWQNITFSSRPVNLIRLVCTQIYNCDFKEFRIFKFNFDFTN